MTHSSTLASPRPGGEEGTGLLGSIVGMTVFLVLLLFAVQLALNLYATSAVTGVAFDAARVVAGAGGGVEAVSTAEANARAVLADFESGGGRLDFEWSVAEDVVEVRVRARRPSLLPGVPLPFEAVDRSVRVRREAFR
jgi:hypothetical protein